MIKQLFLKPSVIRIGATLKVNESNVDPGYVRRPSPDLAPPPPLSHHLLLSLYPRTPSHHPFLQPLYAWINNLF